MHVLKIKIVKLLFLKFQDFQFLKNQAISHFYGSLNPLKIAFQRVNY